MLRSAAGIAAVIACVAAAPASGAVRIGSDLAAAPTTNLACSTCSTLYAAGPGVDQVPIDGVIVRWRTRTVATATPIRLLVARMTSASTWRRTGDDDQTTVGTDVQTFETRIPVRRGDWYGLEWPAGDVQFRTLTGASFLVANTQISATADSGIDSAGDEVDLPISVDVEPDVDGDDHGDESQDECPRDAARQLAPCSGTRVGPQLAGRTWQPTNAGVPRGLATVAGPNAAVVPADGVLVRWRLHARLGTYALQLLRPEGASYRNVAETPVGQVPSAPAPSVFAVDARIPVRAGDVLGMRTLGAATYSTLAPASDTVAQWDPGLLPGTARAPDATVPMTAAVSGDVEPDADQDGFGDITQDACPGDAATQATCPPAPPAPPPASTPLTVTVPVMQLVTQTLRPGTARLAVRRLRYRGTRSLPVPLTCPATVESCRGVLELKVAKRAAGKASFVLRAGQRKSVTVRLSARARRALRRGGRVSARIVPAGPAATNGALTLTR